MRSALPRAAVAVGLAVALPLSVAARRPEADTDRTKQKSVAPQETAEEAADVGHLDPLGPNAACYVCHVTFVDEPLAVEHLREKITCVDCHGASQGHANDEDIGATPPDIVIKRLQVNDSCRKCHKGHDVRPERLIARWIKRVGSDSARGAKVPLQPLVVCTDCHGSHRVSRAQRDRAPSTKEPKLQ